MASRKRPGKSSPFSNGGWLIVSQFRSDKKILAGRQPVMGGSAFGAAVNPNHQPPGGRHAAPDACHRAAHGSRPDSAAALVHAPSHAPPPATPNRRRKVPRPDPVTGWQRAAVEGQGERGVRWPLPDAPPFG